MPTHGPFTFDTQTGSDADRFLWTDPVATDQQFPQASGTARRWCHDTNDTPSTDVGPTSGAGGSPDGYVYTEASTPAAANDVFIMTFDTALDAASFSWVIKFKTNQRGGDNNTTCQVQINESGGGWTNVGTLFGGVGDSDKVATGGTQIWSQREVDLSDGGLNNDSSTQVRIVLTFPSSGTLFHNDYGIDEVEFIGGSVPQVSSATGANPSYLKSGESGVVVAGSNFGASQGSGKVELWSDLTGTTKISQTVTAWSDTSITINASRSTLSEGRVYLVVTNNEPTESNKFRVVILDAAPDTKVVVTRAALNTSTGTQDITDSALGGATPKAVVAYLVRSTADGATAHSAISIGAASSASAEASITVARQDNLTTSVVRRRGSTSKLIEMLEPTSTGNVEVSAELTSFITNGIRLNITTAPGSAFQVVLLLFAGTHVDARLDILQPGGVISDLGWDPDITFSGASGEALDVAATSFSSITHGAARHAGASSSQYMAQGQDMDDANTTQQMLYAVYDLLDASQVIPTTWEAKSDVLSDDLDSGYRCTIVAGSAASDRIWYLALLLPGTRVHVGQYSPPSSTGNAAHTGVGFKPQFCMIGGGFATTYGTIDSTADADTICYGFFTEDAEQSVGMSGNDGGTTTVTRSLLENRAAFADNGAQSRRIAADFVSMDSDGFTLNFTDVAGAGRAWGVLAIEAIPDAGITLSPSAVAIPLALPSPVLDIPISLAPSPGASGISVPSVQIGRQFRPSPAVVPVVAPSAAIDLQLSLSPDAVPSPLVVPAMAVASAIDLEPTPAATATVAPSVQVNREVTPDPAVTPLAVPSVALDLQSQVTPDAAVVPVVAPAPAVIADRDVTPSPAVTPIAAPAPQVDLQLDLAPDPAASALVAPAAALDLQLSVSPDPAATPIVAPQPSVDSDYSLTPDPAQSALAVPAAQVDHALDLAPDAAVAPIAAPAVTLDLQSQVSPAPAVTNLQAPAPTVDAGAGGTTLTPDPASSAVVAPAVTVQHLLNLTPGAVAVPLSVPAATLLKELALAPDSAAVAIVVPAAAADLVLSLLPASAQAQILAPDVAQLVGAELAPDSAVIALVIPAPSVSQTSAGGTLDPITEWGHVPFPREEEEIPF